MALLPYWLEESLPGILPALWMSLGVGLPWALASLPARQWSSRAMLLALALALGPALTSGWMLLLGVVGAQIGQPLLEAHWLIAGSVALAGVGGWLAWRKRGQYRAASNSPAALAVDEKLIIALIAVAVVLRWAHTAWWSFTAYDALWVYGYQARLYFLEGVIPHAIDYYPQFLQTQFAWQQILVGAINDHAARMCLPLLHIGSILATYLLGSTLAGRRAGLIAAALWSLHPFVGRWSTVGDLEIPLAFSFTLAAVFLLRAWRHAEAAGGYRRDALLAGLLLGIALYTKPTAGAFLWGALLLLALEMARTRLRWHGWRPRFMVLLWMGLACIPLGGVWYLRNLALGHEVITLPAAYWLTQARRSGDYLNWLLLALAAVFLWLALERGISRRAWALGVPGLCLALAGCLASSPLLDPARYDPPASYIQPLELALMGLGCVLVGRSLVSRGRALSGESRRQLVYALWSLALALPYFVTFFFSYSYHYRLGFAITPLLIVPVALALSRILSPRRIGCWSRGKRRLYHLLLALLCLPGVVVVALDLDWRGVWLLDGRFDSDRMKYQAFNPSLMEVVDGLDAFQRENDRQPVVLAPGEERLPFFFPQMQIVAEPLGTLEQAERLGATHYVFGAKARQAYRQTGIDPLDTQLAAALGRLDLFSLKAAHYAGTFSYELYEISDLARRYEPLTEVFVTDVLDREVRFGDHLRLLAEDAYPPLLVKGTPITLQTAWRLTEAMARDIWVELELRDEDSGTAAHHWRFQLGVHRHGHYPTRLWDLGEAVKDTTVARLPADKQVAQGDNYVFRLRVVDAETGDYLPLSVDGAAAGEYWQLDGRHRVAR